jgi:hypothetical protein
LHAGSLQPSSICFLSIGVSIVISEYTQAYEVGSLVSEPIFIALLLTVLLKLNKDI